MKSEFIENANTRKFFEICSELSDPSSMTPAERDRWQFEREYGQG